MYLGAAALVNEPKLSAMHIACSFGHLSLGQEIKVPYFSPNIVIFECQGEHLLATESHRKWTKICSWENTFRLIDFYSL